MNGKMKPGDPGMPAMTKGEEGPMEMKGMDSKKGAQGVTHKGTGTVRKSNPAGGTIFRFTLKTIDEKDINRGD